MKECPRCDSTLSHYALAEGEAYGCDACGWAGVDVEHRSVPAPPESWPDAISRFEAKFASDGTDDAVRTLERVSDQVAVPDDDTTADPEPTVDRVANDEPAVPPADDDATEPAVAPPNDETPESDRDDQDTRGDDQDTGGDQDLEDDDRDTGGDQDLEDDDAAVEAA